MSWNTVKVLTWKYKTMNLDNKREFIQIVEKRAIIWYYLKASQQCQACGCQIVPALPQLPTHC